MRRLAVVALAAACSAPAKPTGPTAGDRNARVVKYAPLAMKADAKLPTQAVILGTDRDGGSTVTPLVAGEGHATVDGIQLTIGPSLDGAPPSGVDAGVWLAAIAATTALGKDPTDVTFTAQLDAKVDAVSSSALIAVGFLAALTGAKLDDKATILGIVMPDGTIGPVSDLAGSLIAAFDHGKRTIGVPVGATAGLAKTTHGPTIVEVADVHDAYRLMTGTALPHPVAVDDADMAIDDEAARVLDARYDSWQQQVATHWARLLELDAAGRLPASLLQLAHAARREATAAEKLHNQGLSAPAYDRIITASIYVASATTIADLLTEARDGNLEAARAKLTELAADSAVHATTPHAIGAVGTDTVGAHIEVISAFATAVSGGGFDAFAAGQLDAATRFLTSLAGAPADKLQSDTVADDVVATVAPAVLTINRGVAANAMAMEAIDLEQATDVRYQAAAPTLVQLTAPFHAAATASLAYVDAQARLADDAARTRYAATQPDYLIAAAALGKDWGADATAWPLALLATSQLALFRSSRLIADAALGVVRDPVTGLPTKAAHENLLVHLLTSGERAAREHARAARIATGSIPIEARIAYQDARALRDGDVADQLRALEALWRSSLWSQTAEMLARN